MSYRTRRILRAIILNLLTILGGAGFGWVFQSIGLADSPWDGTKVRLLLVSTGLLLLASYVNIFEEV